MPNTAVPTIRRLMELKGSLNPGMAAMAGMIVSARIVSGTGDWILKRGCGHRQRIGEHDTLRALLHVQGHSSIQAGAGFQRNPGALPALHPSHDRRPFPRGFP